MEKLLRLGAYYAFENDEETERFGEEDIDLILSKSTRIKHENDESRFSITQFELDDDDVDLAAPDFWQKYLPEIVEDAIDDRRIERSK
jgi:chromodomain-helicase-DNA-binding protein 7